MEKKLRNLLYTVSLIVLTSFLPGCKKEYIERDITPPEINIISPLEG
jgi:hypothetical protein